jgi:L-ascorbate 6-phosphate lactonase
MKSLLDHPLAPAEAALWWLGQAGCVVRAGGATVVIDPYLSDSAAAGAVSGVENQGVFALPTGADVLGTTGYLLSFASGRSVYHTSDSAFHPLALAAAPRAPEVMLVPINGKWGNPGPEQAAEFAAAVNPRFVFPNHYDLMALNAENPETFRWFCKQRGLGERCVIARRMEPFVWS